MDTTDTTTAVDPAPVSVPTSTAADFFTKAGKRRIEPATGLEPWGLNVHLRSLMESEQAAHEFGMIDAKAKGIDEKKLRDSRVELIALCVCDKSGTPLFSKHQLNDLKRLDGKLIAVLNKQCRIHCGMSEDELGDKKKTSETPSTSDDVSPSA